MRTHTAKKVSRRIITLSALFTLLLGVHSAFAQQSLETFTSSANAAHALYEAVKKNDEQAVRAILGGGPELTSQDNAEQEKINRDQFVSKYEAMHRLVREPDGATVLYIGAENWPFPIPLRANNGKWYFDADAGSQEVLAREIGRNETIAFNVCQAFGKAGTVDMEADASARDFAAKLRNTLGANSDPIPFEGYYFHVVKENPTATVLVAYPAEYRLTGVMTFKVKGEGPVYEKDLGPQTATQVKKIEANAARGWVAVR